MTNLECALTLRGCGQISGLTWLEWWQTVNPGTQRPDMPHTRREVAQVVLTERPFRIHESAFDAGGWCPWLSKEV